MNIETATSNLHYDMSDNLLCVVHGSKTVWLFPPACTAHLQPRPPCDLSPNHSAALPTSDGGETSNHGIGSSRDGGLDGLDRDSPTSPRACGGRVVVLHAGDALHIPEGEPGWRRG